MAKRKKHMRLPNGYGSIKYLGKGRRNPYGVYPPVTEFTEEGAVVQPKALCYTDSWTKGFAILTAYKTGSYYQGMELDMQDVPDGQTEDSVIQSILADYGRLARAQRGIEEPEKGKTFSEIYEAFRYEKYDAPGAKKFSKSSVSQTKTAYNHCSTLYDREFNSIRYDDLQSVVDACPLKHASLELIVTLFHQMYAYAMKHDLCDKDYSAQVKIKKDDDDEHGVPFTDEELEILWKNQEDETVEFILIMCYSGYRISAFKTMEVNLDENYFKGGVKTRASRDRMVPIHSAIIPLVARRLQKHGALFYITGAVFRGQMYKTLDNLGIVKHTPHDCRHTFSRLCEKYKVAENDRKRMLGHSFGTDITNAIYGHRSVEDLRSEIEKIMVPEFVASLLLIEPDLN